jgi:hypothetical protein
MNANFTRWTADQLAYVRAHYATTRTEDVAKHLGRTVGAVRLAAQRMGCKRESPSLGFELERTLICITQHPGLRRAEIAEKLRKGVVAVGRTLNVLHTMKLARAEGRGRATQWHAIPDAEPVPRPKYEKRAAVQQMPNRWAGVASIFGVAA